MKITSAKALVSAVVLTLTLAGASPAALSHAGANKPAASEGMMGYGSGPTGMMSGMGPMGMMEHMREHMDEMGHMASTMGGMGGMGPMMGGMGGMGPMMGGMGMAGMIELSDEQRSQLNSIGDELRKRHWEIMGPMMEEWSVLRDLWQAKEHDPKAIGAAYGRLFDLRRQMIEAAIEANNRRRSLLSDEQREQLKQRHQERHQRWLQGEDRPEGAMMNPGGMMGQGAGGAMRQGPGGTMGQGHMMPGKQ